MAHEDLTAFIAHKADPLLAELVPLAGATSEASLHNVVLYEARESDCYELLDGLCIHKVKALVIVAASELALVGWRHDGAVTR